MTNEVKMVAIADKKMSGLLTDITVGFMTVVRQPNESTYVQLSRGASNAPKYSQDFIASIPIHHPDGVVIDDSNWAGFLYQNLFLAKDMTKTFHGVQNVRGCRSIKARIAFGDYYFEIDTVNFGVIGIIAPRGGIRVGSMRSLPSATLIVSPFGDQESEYLVLYNNLGISVNRPNIVPTSPQTDRSYRAWFSIPLSLHQQMKAYIEGFDALDINNSWFDLSGVDQDSTTLLPNQFYEFEYLQSQDGRLKVTLQRNPVTKMFRSLSQFEEARQDPVISHEINQLRIIHAVSDQTPEALKRTLNLGIRLIQGFTQA
jgi:hypothetical protein